ncbi:MAG: hypothetical protein HC906_08220 [Bacteroidales bacterium]|nr:hypothetical protein [Bacteroidales bacterium]
MNTIHKIIPAIFITLVLAISSSLVFSKIKYGVNDIERFQKKFDAKVEYLDQVINQLYHSGEIIPFSKLKRKRNNNNCIQK